MKEATPTWPMAPSPLAESDGFDPLEEAGRGQVRAFIEELLEEDWRPRSGGAVTSEVRVRTVVAPGADRASW